MISARQALMTWMAATCFTATFVRAQQTPEEHTHHHMEIQPVRPVYPHMGRAQENPQGKRFTLDDAEHLAADSNPTLRQAEAEIRAAQARLHERIWL